MCAIIVSSVQHTKDNHSFTSNPCFLFKHLRKMDAHRAPIIQRLCHLFDDIYLTSESTIYYKEIGHYWAECMTLLRPLFEDIQESSLTLNDDEVSNLHALEVVCMKIKEHLEKCTRKASKTFLVGRRTLLTGFTFLLSSFVVLSL